MTTVYVDNETITLIVLITAGVSFIFLWLLFPKD
jgi:hypothetical protein